MFIRDTIWERIRGLFEEAEKVQLRTAVTGETICPRGFIIDEEQLAPELLARLKDAIRAWTPVRK